MWSPRPPESSILFAVHVLGQCSFCFAVQLLRWNLSCSSVLLQCIFGVVHLLRRISFCAALWRFELELKIPRVRQEWLGEVQGV